MNKDSLDNTDLNLAVNLPFSQACENNKQPILRVLQRELKDATHVLEVGSGTGQHSVYFAPNLAHLQWQTSDVSTNHYAIEAWQTAYPASNLHPPVAFDLTTDSIPISRSNQPYDAIFTANTLHIISWELVEQLFQLVGEALPIHGKLIVYGPFNENGQYTSAGNHQFDLMLRQSDLQMGIRDREDVIALAKKNKLTLSNIVSMPASNQLLVFIKTAVD